MPSVDTFQPVDFAVLGVTGLVLLLTLFGAWYTIPWRRRSRRAEGNKEFNVFWQGRATLELFSALWVAAQLLRLSSVWGSNSFVFPSLITDWTGAGWFCRVYLTAALGFFQPFCSLFTLLFFTAATSRKRPPTEAHHPNGRLLFVSLLATLPVLAVQAAIAWVGLALRQGGQPCEARPRSVLGYFFATYWYGDVEQCAGSQGCTLCVFPAAAVIAHALFSAAYLVALWVTSSRMAATVLNKRLKRRLRFFQLADFLLVVAGVAALGGSIVKGPFSWVNQGCWVGYFGTVAATVALVSWEVVIWPALDLSRLNQKLELWKHASDTLGEAGGEGYIKAVPMPHALGAQPGASADLLDARSHPVPPMASAPPASHA